MFCSIPVSVLFPDVSLQQALPHYTELINFFNAPVYVYLSPNMAASVSTINNAANLRG